MEGRNEQFKPPIKGNGRHFPKEPEIEFEKSVIEIPLRLKGIPEREVDVMRFDAYMRLNREAPRTNKLGYNQFEFTIEVWELTNCYSKGLEANVTFTLSKTTQPKSLCISMNKAEEQKDYPAIIIYSAIYDIYLDDKLLLKNQPGVAYAQNVLEIPPRNVLVAFEKPYEGERFMFDSGTCGGMRPINKDEFLKGVIEARRVRGDIDPLPPDF